MPDSTAEFFEALGERGHEPLLAKIKGTLRFDLTHDKHLDHWRVEIDDGSVAVSREAGAADAAVRAERALFDRVVSGDANALAAVLRGTLEVDGENELLMRFQRVFPGPAARRRRRAGAPKGSAGAPKRKR